MLDKITVEVIRHAAIFTAEEMGIVLRNTAFSPNIRDRLDYSCAVLAPSGELVAQAEHIPVHLGSMPVGVRNMVEALERNGVSLGPGDVAVSNDPYITGTHLNDVMVLKPVYVDGVLVAYVANKAHHVDVGGLIPGGIGAGVRSLREEGLVIPPVKIVENGRLREDIVRLIESNVRTPRYLRGDLMAQLAALNTGEKRVQELARRYGVETLLEAWEEILSYTERYTRTILRSLAKERTGVYTAEDYVELESGELAKIRVRLEISPERIVADFTGTARQVEEPLNAVYGVTVAATTYAIKAVIDPDMPMNSGFYRVVEIRAPRGTLVNPVPPAPVGGGNVETSQRIADVVLRALAEAFPGRVPAASCGTMSNLLLGGKGWAFYETIGCGSGGRPCCDGVDGVHTNMTNTLNTPIEVAEAEYPLLFRAYELRPDSGGPGRNRGGLGIVRAVTVLEDDVTVTVYAERHQLRPWGLEGGGAGAPFRSYVIRAGGEKVELPPKATLRLGRGDTVYVETPGGGGYGDPCERPRELVERDIEDGKVSPEAARHGYCYEG
ncbi:N-methylhydantoinase B/acetone carboxylase, alpha subunit [Pyrodictium delaneyi]|uniref:5-oxoprolinase n=1 Tax=Pyrodictium delaneyi TaxID=1273541 RepID=A0A0N7JD17_9CREN|nr:hydantoinase B/oxoprolinase family protein [Pyrodictium delaneyi]ALL00945.1 N-methylhydantoinase B/acetone carboxylase, alpha subunit [Pyrodictium delaneyi]OWJ55444.1 5-oxoprolinase [Pyrodictium delaneyi]